MRSTAYIPSERWSRIDGGMDSTEKHGEGIVCVGSDKMGVVPASDHAAGLNCLRQCNLVPEGDGMKTWREYSPISMLLMTQAVLFV